MKSLFPVSAHPRLLLTSCGREPARRAAQPQPRRWRASSGGCHARLAGELRSHRHGPRPHHGHDLQQSDGLRAAGERASRRPCSRRADIDYAGRAGPGCESAPRRGRPAPKCGAPSPNWKTPRPPPRPIWIWRKATFKRMEELATKKSISNQELDEASARLKAAQANYDMVRSRRAQVDSKMAVVEQEVRAAAESCAITPNWPRLSREW